MILLVLELIVVTISKDMSYPIVCCYVGNSQIIENDCICCAERKMIHYMLRLCAKKGFSLNEFPSWLHRKHGTMVIYRLRHDGTEGISIPCVMCRKRIDKFKIRWSAFDGTDRVGSSSKIVPVSRPTNKQRRWMNFT